MTATATCPDCKGTGWVRSDDQRDFEPCFDECVTCSPINTDVQHDLLAWQAAREVDTTTPYDIEETDDQHRIIGIDDSGEPITDQDDEPQHARDLRRVADDVPTDYQCACGRYITFGDHIDGTDTLYDCSTCGTRHNLGQDDEPDWASDLTGWNSYE